MTGVFLAYSLTLSLSASVPFSIGVNSVQPKMYMTEFAAKMKVQYEASKRLVLTGVPPFTCSHFDGYGMKDAEYQRLVDRLFEGFLSSLKSVSCTSEGQ